MADALTDDDIPALRERHRISGKQGYCWFCRSHWPCPCELALARIERDAALLGRCLFELCMIVKHEGLELNTAKELIADLKAAGVES